MTIFSIPKEFVDEHISLIQNKAIQSWVAFGDVFLMGKDKGVNEKAQEYGIKNITDIKYNEKGTPFVSSAFKKIQEVADDGIYMFTNTDIVFDESLKKAIEKLPKDKKFLVVGRRIDIDTKNLIQTNNDAGLQRFARKDDDELCSSSSTNFALQNSSSRAKRSDPGKLHSPAGIDYFIFPKGLFTDMPDLLVGRIGWDNWMIYHANKSGYMVIDATNVINAYHQNLDYPNYNKGVERKTNSEAQANIKIIGSKKNVCTIEDANWKFNKKGNLKRNWWCWFVKLKRITRIVRGL